MWELFIKHKFNKMMPHDASLKSFELKIIYVCVNFDDIFQGEIEITRKNI